MATLPVPLTSQQMTDRFFTMLKSLEQFDELEVRNVIGGLLSPSDREKCFIAIYRRATANVLTLLNLNRPIDFQAISMLSRALFELAVDIRAYRHPSAELRKNDCLCERREVALRSSNPEVQN